ncbi:hypothetical protein D3C72_2208520 [compost metagenome]
MQLIWIIAAGIAPAAGEGSLLAWHQGQALIAIGPLSVLRLQRHAHVTALEPSVQAVGKVRAGRVAGLAAAA